MLSFAVVYCATVYCVMVHCAAVHCAVVHCAVLCSCLLRYDVSCCVQLGIHYFCYLAALGSKAVFRSTAASTTYKLHIASCTGVVGGHTAEGFSMRNCKVVCYLE